jgi:5'-3' exonuclease
LTGRQFKKLSALLGSEKMTEIMKSIHSKNLLENDGNDALFQTRYALESMFGEFDFDSKNLIEAILVADPMYESKILE